ncbi:MAG: FtsH protease activity modulator HflK [Deltaproteobacteria bacterium]|nr:MAG: FtsH protease activity modulator HflK [Deltaproteobacteria bacterium]
MVLVLLVGGWISTGFYIVAPDEVGVVKRFGKAVRTEGPGPHLRIPFPIETVTKPKVTKIRKIEIGFRTVQVGPPARYQAVEKEAHMLTGDENIISLWFIVQYRIKDPIAYLFSVHDPNQAIKDAAESAMREIVGKKTIDEVLTTGRAEVQQETMELLQAMMDEYQTGLAVARVQLQDVHPPEPVANAFKDVASAKEDKERLINEAQGYANDILPKAQGEAARLVKEAEAYSQRTIEHARGDASRFLQILTEYRKAPEVTKKRMYLETMEEVLARSEKTIIDPKAAGNLFPLLRLNP